MEPEDLFERLRAGLPGAPAVTDAEIDALLDLARVAAHGSERWAAPVSTFLVGAALADVEASERVRRIRELTADLEDGAAPRDGTSPQ